jgi:hypothetical protein
MTDIEATPDVLRDVQKERAAQIARGFDAAHDDTHTKNEIAHGAVAKVLCSIGEMDAAEARWPWPRRAPCGCRSVGECWHFTGTAPFDGGRRRLLVEATAMLVAEIERLDRRVAP